MRDKYKEYHEGKRFMCGAQEHQNKKYNCKYIYGVGGGGAVGDVPAVAVSTPEIAADVDGLTLIETSPGDFCHKISVVT